MFTCESYKHGAYTLLFDQGHNVIPLENYRRNTAFIEGGTDDASYSSIIYSNLKIWVTIVLNFYLYMYFKTKFINPNLKNN